VIVHQGAQPIFIDIDPDTYNLDPTNSSPSFSNNADGIRAIAPVDKEDEQAGSGYYSGALWGHPCDMNRINDCAREFRMTVIEDAAHALGATYFGRKVGTLGDMACFSFYPTKNISTGKAACLPRRIPSWRAGYVC